MFSLKIFKKVILRLKNFIKRKLDVESRILIKNSSWVFIANFVSSLFIFLKSVILGRILGAELYGTFLLIVAFVITIQEFLNLNIGTALIKFGADYRTSNEQEKFVALVKSCFLFTGISAIVSILLVAVISHFKYDIFIKKPGLQIYILAYAVGASFSFFDYISTSLLRLYYKFRLNSLIRILLSFVELLSISVIVYFFPKQLPILLITVVAIMFLRGIVINGWALWELRDELFPYIHVELNSIRSDWKNIRNFVLSNSASRTLKTLTSNGDVLILGALAGPTQVGYYGVAKKLAFSILRITDPMRDAVYPQVAALVSKQRYSELKKMLAKVTKIFSIPLILCFFFLLFFRGRFITLIYGPEFLPATKPFLFLFIAASLSSVFFWSLSIIFSLGKVNLRLLVNVIALLVGASLAFLLVPSYGAKGVAIALLTSEVIVQFTFIYVVKKELK